MIGNILLGVFLIVWGLVISLHLPVPLPLVGILGLIAGIVILVQAAINYPGRCG